MECDFHAKWLQITVIPVKEPFAPLPAGDRTTVSIENLTLCFT